MGLTIRPEFVVALESLLDLPYLGQYNFRLESHLCLSLFSVRKHILHSNTIQKAP